MNRSAKVQPRIAMFGSSLVSAYWNGAATYYRGILKALAELGYGVTFFEPDAYGRQQHRDIADPPWAEVVVYSGTDEAAVLSALDQAAHADIIVKASGVGVFDALLEARVLDLGGPDRWVVFWDVDAPATLDRLRTHPSDPFRTLISRYDLILTYGGGDRVVSDYRHFGAAHCVPVYNAVDPETHFPVPPDGRFRCELALLANRLPDREVRIDEFFFRPAEKLREARFLLGGSGWEGRALPSNVRSLGHVYTRDHNVLNTSALAVLNVARDSMAKSGFSPATRVFEAAGAAACIITDAWEGIEHFLEPGREILVARNGDEVAQLLRDLSQERARQVGLAARNRVLAEHTYRHRALQIDALLSGMSQPKSREHMPTVDSQHEEP